MIVPVQGFTTSLFSPVQNSKIQKFLLTFSSLSSPPRKIEDTIALHTYILVILGNKEVAMVLFPHFFKKKDSDQKGDRKSLKNPKQQQQRSSRRRTTRTTRKSGQHHQQEQGQIFGATSMAGYKGNEDMEWCNQDAYLFITMDDSSFWGCSSSSAPPDSRGSSCCRNNDTTRTAGKNENNNNCYCSTNIVHQEDSHEIVVSDRDTKNALQNTHPTRTPNNSQTTNSIVVAVLDGHGIDGHVISEYCRKRIVTLLDSSAADHQHESNGLHRSSCIRSIFEMLQNELEQDEYSVAAMSGTTLTIVRIAQGRIEVFNVGDSPAYLGRRRKDPNGELELIKLTVDHKPDDEVESERIRIKGGKIYSKAVSTTTNDSNATNSSSNNNTAVNANEIDGSSSSFCSQTKNMNDITTYEHGPLRVWYQCNMDNENKSIGLAMTRSIGDTLAHKVSTTEN